jgi:hypothetical protein
LLASCHSAVVKVLRRTKNRLHRRLKTLVLTFEAKNYASVLRPPVLLLGEIAIN